MSGGEPAFGEAPPWWVFVAVEKKPPYAIGIYYVTQEQLDLGRRQARRPHACQARPQRAAGISGQLPGHEAVVKPEAVVITRDSEGNSEQVPVHVMPEGDGFRVKLEGLSHRIAFETPLREVVIHGRIDGRPFCAQIERMGLAYRVIHNGSQIDATVLSPFAAQMSMLMPFKAPPDLSRFLLSPMPGLLVEVTVKPGQKVLAGEKLAVIEAMKMENILFATQDAVVSEVRAVKGESLAVDQVIICFE